MSDPVLQPEQFSAENRPHASAQEQTRPFDIVPLPSKGLLYKDSPLAGKDSIEVFYLTAKEEDILTAPNLLKSGKVMDHLLRAVLVDKNIDPQQLLLGDRNAILVWLRSTGYGAEYPVKITCSECGESFEHEFDLAALNVRFLEIQPDDDGCFTTELPVTKKTIRVKLFTAADDDAIDETVKKRAKKLGGTGNPMTTRLLAHIQDIEGMTADQVRQFIVTLNARDSRHIRKFIADLEPSVIMRQDATCTECGELNEEVVIPITTRFFWPDS